MKDPDNPLDLERARAVCEVSRAITDTAKVEVDLVRAIGGSPGSQFFQHVEEARGLPRPANQPLRLEEQKKPA